MKAKFEEKLAQLAFGDLSPSDAKKLEIEAQSQPEARETLRLYREMRDGLRGMAEVPEDQFSKERLRDAILKQGLKPRPDRYASNRSWLWMPAVACALGFGLVYARHTILPKNVNPQIVMSKKSLMAPPLLAVHEPIRVADNTPSPANSFIGPIQSPLRKTRTFGYRHRPRHHLEPNEVSPNILAVKLDGDDLNPDFGGANSTIPTSPSASDVPPMVATAASTGPIVFIDQDKDEQTGAQKATEVGNASNVLVGG